MNFVKFTGMDGRDIRIVPAFVVSVEAGTDPDYHGSFISDVGGRTIWVDEDVETVAVKLLSAQPVTRIKV